MGELSTRTTLRSPLSARLAKGALFAWGLLAYQIAVIAWGAYVRATISGAGCGQHWPLCKGEIVPRLSSAETRIEFSHRLTSGVAFALTLAFWAWAVREYPKGHRVRRGAGAAALLMTSEAVIGAGLVLLKLVAHDASVQRAVGTGLHLVNTFLLLAAGTLTGWWASLPDRTPEVSPPPRASAKFGRGRPFSSRPLGPTTWALTLCLSATLVVATTGALTALGDTLFPASSLANGLSQDFALGASPYVRLRAIHPLFAVATAGIVLATMALVRVRHGDRAVHIFSRITVALALFQVALGLLDITLLAPVALQLAHLVAADLLWIALVLTSGAVAECLPDAVAVTAAHGQG